MPDPWFGEKILGSVSSTRGSRSSRQTPPMSFAQSSNASPSDGVSTRVLASLAANDCMTASSP